MKYVVKRTDGLYLQPARSYWDRVRFRRAGGIDETKWSADLQKARVFGSAGGATSVWKHDHACTIVAVKLVEA